MTKPKPVLTKRDFVRRYAKGEFGNASPTWNTIGEFTRADPRGELFHIRNRVADGPTWYNKTKLGVFATWAHLKLTGVPTDSLYISAMAPTHKTLFQGEVRQSEKYLDLRYSTVVATMREALAKQQYHTNGIMAVWALKYYLCPNSYEWMHYLLDSYPSHVIEFSTYSVNWGTLPNYNTVFWEVRKY